MSKKHWAGALIVIGLLVWWLYPRKPLPMGYMGTAVELKETPGIRPKVEMPISAQYITNLTLKLDGRELNQQTGEFTLPRGQALDVEGRLELDLGRTGEFSGIEISIASHSKNRQGFLIEGETMLNDGYSYTSGKPLVLEFSKKWQVPDRFGEFLLLVVYHTSEIGELNGTRRFAIVRPVRLE